MSSTLNKIETDICKNDSNEEEMGDEYEKKNKLLKDSTLNSKSLMGLNHNKSINDITKLKLSKMDLDLEVKNSAFIL